MSSHPFFQETGRTGTVLQPSNMPLRFHTSWLLWTLLLLPNGKNEAVEAFSGSSGEVLPSNAMWRVSTSVGRTFQGSRTRLFAKPERLQENVEGVVYVNDRVSQLFRSRQQYLVAC
jgi:hypothetical protein